MVLSCFFLLLFRSSLFLSETVRFENFEKREWKFACETARNTNGKRKKNMNEIQNITRILNQMCSMLNRKKHATLHAFLSCYKYSNGIHSS